MANKKSVAKAYVQVVPTTQGIKGILGNAFGAEGASAGGLFGGELIGAVKGIVAAAGIGKMLTESILAGANMEQSLGGIETLFKDSADVVIANAENAYKTAGMSANAYMEAVTGFSASLLQGLGGDTQEAARISDMALTDMSDNANKMGTSMDLIQNAYQGFAKQNYTMLDNLKLGYGGTKTEMQRLLKDAQKLTGVKYDISNLADVYEAIHVIQEEMHISGMTAEEAAEMVAAGLMTEEEAFEAMGTTAKEAATTLSGSFASMKAAVSDLLANLALGRDLEDSLEAVTETVFTFAGNLLPAVGRALSGLPAMLRTAFSTAIRGLRLVADNSDALVEQGVGLVIEIGEAIITALPYLAEAAFELVAAFGATILETDWIGLATDTITGIQQSLSLAAAEILGHDGSLVDAVYSSILEHLPTALQGGIEIVLELVNGILSQIPAAVEAVGDLMGDFLSFLAESVPDVLEAGAELVLGLVDGIIECLPDVCESAVTVCMELLTTIGEELPEFLASGIEIICELAAGLIEAIPDALEAMGEVLADIGSAILDFDWLDFGEDIIGGIADGVTAGAGALWTSIKRACGDALAWAKGFLGIASPSKVMRDEIGQFIPAGIAAGIDENTDAVTTSIHHLARVTVESFDSLNTEPRRVYNAPRWDVEQAPVAREADRREINIEIHVHAAEGMDEDALTERVMYRLQMELEREGAAIGTG